MSKMSLAEYIWIDGTIPVRGLRSKSKVIQIADSESMSIKDFPIWNFDGSSTSQSKGTESDLILQPVNFVKDPIRGEGNFLVLCEVMNQDGTPHASNSRAAMRKVLDAGGSEIDPWAGFEQEYTLFKHNRPLGWPEDGFPRAQGPYYCGVGTEDIFGRDLVETHLKLCMEAGLIIYGINAEVMPGQWEFQVGYRGIEGDDPSALNVADHLWIARWLLLRASEKFDISVSFSNKPMPGDWNGAGCHTNFSTLHMRAEGGLEAIEEAVSSLAGKHMDHINHYGHDLEKRLTGEHETCHIGEFKAGISDRGCSIRIPLHVKERGQGYLEDRRPGANCDPYLVVSKLIQTICSMSSTTMEFGDWSMEAILAAK